MSTQLDLHDALRRYSYDHAFFCTFNFQADFFEEYCLEQFDSLETNNGITVIMDGRELDRLVSGPNSRWPRKANVRYLLHGARPKGRFHPKVFLLASKTRGMLMVGSANLTRSGLTKNAELAKTFSFEIETNENSLPLFQAAVQFLREVAAMWPSDELTKRLRDLDAEAPWLNATPLNSLPARLMHNLAKPLFPQIIDSLNSPVHELAVVSPFFDEKPLLMDWVTKNLQPQNVAIFTRNSAPSLTPSWTEHPAMRSNAAQLLFSHWGDEEQSRQLHGKAIAITHGESTRIMFGSANFTRAALLSTPENGNVEVVLALEDVPRGSVAVHELLDPNGSGKPGPLMPFERPLDEPDVSYALRLIEAGLEDKSFRCQLGSEVSAVAVEATLLFHDGGSQNFKLEGLARDWRAKVDEATAKRADRGTTVAFVRSVDGLESNRVLLINLKDISTGDAHRKARRIKDAQRSAEQFTLALLDLLRLKDCGPLQSFLTFCDIPLAGVIRLRGSTREAISFSQLQAELRQFGEKNLRDYRSLHDAAIGFCARHVARLTRHARRPSLDAIPGCMHLVRSVAGVLATQIERLLTGLTQVDSVSIDEWYSCRTNLDQLLGQWVGLLRVVHLEWLVALGEVYDFDEIRAAVRPDLEPLKDVAKLFADVRARAVEAMKTFRVQTPNGNRVAPPLARENTLDPKLWQRWHEEVKKHQLALDAIGGG